MYHDGDFRGPLVASIQHYSIQQRRVAEMVRDEPRAPPKEESPAWRSGPAVAFAFMLGALGPGRYAICPRSSRTAHRSLQYVYPARPPGGWRGEPTLVAGPPTEEYQQP
jgi:hypothetical protein